MREIWKDIEGYEGLYQVSSLGRIKSLDRYVSNGRGLRLLKGRILKPEITKFGYMQISLCNENVKHKRFKVHRLVAKAFIPNHNNLPQINHIDEVKTNNSLSNLEWCDAFYNQNHGTCSARKRCHLINHPKKSFKVAQYSLDGVYITSFPSMREATRKTGIKEGCISNVCNGKVKSAGGYFWKRIYF